VETTTQSDTQQQSHQLSPNFTRAEFEHSGPMPEECVPIFEQFCVRILEQIRLQFDQPMEITSGDRRPEANAACAGNLHSEHISTPRYCAGDFTIPLWRKDLRGVFDWIRLNSGLPFHHVTLEHGAGGDVIHISLNLDNQDRIAKEGATHNASGYVDWAVA
jgi:hypothetical protein